MPSYGPPINTERAKQVVSVALAHARANGWAMAAAVVDPNGTLVYFEKIDDTQHASPRIAIDKARSAAMFKRPLPPWTFLNVNVPKGQPKGIRTTVQAKRNHITSVAVRYDPKGRAYFWIEEGQDEWEPHDRSDYQAVRDGYVSVTPLHPDLTAHHALAAVQELSLESEAERPRKASERTATSGTSESAINILLRVEGDIPIQSIYLCSLAILSIDDSRKRARRAVHSGRYG